MSLASPFFSPRAAGRSAVSLVSPASFQLFKHISQISFQLLHAHVFGTAQIKMKHWMLDLFLLIICNGQSFEKFFPSLKISLKGRGKKKFRIVLGDSERRTSSFSLENQRCIWSYLHRDNCPLGYSRMSVFLQDRDLLFLPYFHVLYVLRC